LFGLAWGRKEKQSDRLAHYDSARDRLIASNRLYPCYETPQELEFRRKRCSPRAARRSTTAPR
jgi:glutamyl-tRNA synthetase